MSKDCFQMTSIVLGRVGLLSSILVGLASSPALASTPVPQDSGALKGATQEPTEDHAEHLEDGVNIEDKMRLGL